MKHISVSSVTQRLPENCRSFSHLKYLAQSLCRPSDEEYGTVRSDYLALVLAKSIADYYHMSRSFSKNKDTPTQSAKNFLNELWINLPPPSLSNRYRQIKARDYQIDAVHNILESDRGLILSPTGSGKSFIIYALVRYYVQRVLKVLIVVPTTSLVEQMFTDFADYGWASDEYCHRVYAG